MGPLYADFEAFRDSAVVQQAIATTGAVVMGTRTFAMGDPDSYADSYEFQVPIFVITHHPPATMSKENGRLRFTFVTDGIDRAIDLARSAAGDKDVMIVGGAATIRLHAGLVDELQIGLVPILLGGGQRLFDPFDAAPIQLEHVETIESPGWTDLRFRVTR